MCVGLDTILSCYQDESGKYQRLQILAMTGRSETEEIAKATKAFLEEAAGPAIQCREVIFTARVREPEPSGTEGCQVKKIGICHQEAASKSRRTHVVPLEDKGVADFFLLHWQNREILHIQLDPNSAYNTEIYSKTEHVMDISTRIDVKNRLWNGCMVVQRNQSFEVFPL